ncbi:MAG: Na-translocating system protein MpsC family protein [Solirubrobacteraceae bacterium]
MPEAPPHRSTPRRAITDLGADAAGDVLSAVSDGMVALLKEFYGRGPTRAKSYYQDDLVVCVLRGGFSRVEQTLLEGGRGSAVIQQRMEFQELMRDRFTGVVEQATGRPVIGFMSGNQQHPDLMCEVFVLGPTDLVDDDTDGEVDGHGSSGGSSLPA